jgi:hypothetical protein
MSLAITHPQNTAPDTSQLEALARHALEPNIFHEATLLQPALTHLGSDTVKLCTSIDAHTGALTSALPVARAKGRYGPLSIVPTPIVGWQHPYAMVGTPLLDRAHGEAALNDLFDAIADQFSGAKVLLLRHLRTDGPLWPLMKAVMDHSDRRYTILETYDRAGLDVTDPGQTTLRKLIGKKSASSIRASRRKLGELGTVRHEVAQDGQTVSKALETFLHLEASGWKGRAGTALLNAGAGHAAFVREAVTQLAVAQRVRIDSLSLDGEPVAGTLSIRDGSKAAPNWMPWKTAYNERFTDYGPGSLILHDLTDSLLHEATQAGTPLLLDSLAVSDSVIANRLWRHRWSFADILIDLSPSGSAAFGPIRMAERARAAARQIAKRTAKPAKHHLTSRGQDKQS